LPTIVYTSKDYELLQEIAKYYQYFTVKILEFFLSQSFATIGTILVPSIKTGQSTVIIHDLLNNIQNPQNFAKNYLRLLGVYSKIFTIFG